MNPKHLNSITYELSLSNEEAYSDEDFKRMVSSGKIKIVSDYHPSQILSENQQLAVLKPSDERKTIDYKAKILKLEQSLLQTKDLARKFLNDNTDLKKYIEIQENDFYEISEKREAEFDILSKKYAQLIRENEDLQNHVSDLEKQIASFKVCISNIKKEMDKHSNILN